MVDIYSILTQSQELLKQTGIDSYKLDAEILLCHVKNISKSTLITDPKATMSPEEINKFHSLIAKRLEHMPIAKIIAKKEFYGLEFTVNKDVLDPRPDTETLIDIVLKYFPNQKDKLSFLDIGTGSGNIAITLATLYPDTTILATDISDKALNIAQCNAKTHNVNKQIKFLTSDLFQHINGKFDLIISNPPYIETDNIDLLADEVKLFDPTIALDGGVTGLNYYNLIAQQATKFLTPEGLIIVEIGFNQKHSVTEIFQTYNYILHDAIKDLGQNNRCLVFKNKYL